MAAVRRTIIALVLLTVGATPGSPGADHMIHRQPGRGVGAVEGFVRLAGEETPSPTRVENTTDPEVCGREQSLEDLVVAGENRGIRYAIVALIDVPHDALPARQPTRPVVDNRDCRFDPHVTAVMVGDTIVAANSDPILHNTHLYGALRENIALPVTGMTVSRVARRAGMISVLCDIHGWMKAFIRVDDHPFHAVTDDRGYFRISDIPAGRYTLDIWHERLGTRRIQIGVASGTTSRVVVDYPETSADSPREP